MKILQLLLSALVVLLLVSCAAPTKVPSTTVTPAPASEPVQQQQRSADYYINRAEQSPEALKASWLLKAADSLSADRCADKLAITALLEGQFYDPSDRTLSAIVSAECRVDTAEKAEIQPLLGRMMYQQGYDRRIFALQSRFYAKQGQWIEAAQAWMKTGIAEPERSQQVWQWVSQLSDSELASAAQVASDLRPYLVLEQLLRSDLHRPIALQQGVAAWQRRFYPVAQNLPLPDTLEKGLLTLSYKPQHIAVILPLSGKLAEQGQALKDGVIAAYYQHPVAQKPKLSFVDSAQNVANALTPLLQSGVEPVDFVIGPLLKGDIPAVSRLLPEELPMLALNLPEQLSNSGSEQHRYYYGLTPEDEAEQLAVELLQRDKQLPVLLVSDSPTFTRMAERFTQVWLANTGISVEQRVFTDNATMRKQVANLLDVDDSRTRIKQVEKLISKEVLSFSRSRRDVDAIITFANREQTELLNPMIEASISPFADIVPVYASSRSYSLNMSKNSVRDLRDLSFVDMPWMLPKNPAPDLMASSRALWPSRKDNDLRLFALGFDAFELIGKLAHMRLTERLKHKGLTGELSLTSAGKIRRKLPWAQISQQGVVDLAMD